MRQRLIYLLKHNSVMQKTYRVLMSFCFQVLGVFVPVDKKRILFVSFMGKGFNDSPKAIYDSLKNNEEYRDYTLIWAFEEPEKFPDVLSVRIDTLSYFFTALRAKYWITNTNIERGLRFKKSNQRYLNTWHGIALKHIGNDCPGRKDYNFDTVDYLVVSGKHDEKVWKSAFNAKKETYLRCGMPRNEELWQATTAEKESIRNKLELPGNKKIILFAPTWRESKDGGRSYEMKPPIHFELWKEKLGENYIILFRAHHQTTKVLGIQFDEFVRDYSDYPSINDLIIVSDLLITDYSAIAFDYSILCKPIFCYAYDYEEYLAERGTYFDMDEYYPNKTCRTEEQLLERITNMNYQQECENTRHFRDYFIQYYGNSIETCVTKLMK